MPDLELDRDTAHLKGIGPSRSRDLAAAGIHTLADLLGQLPTRYEDRRRRYSLEEIRAPGEFCVHGRIRELKRVRIRRRGLTLIRGWIEQSGRRLPVLWFNRPYLLDQVDEGVEYSLYGRFRSRGAALELVNPVLEPVGASEWTESIVPIYSTVAGISGTMLRRLIGQIFELCNVEAMEDPLPDHLRTRYSLPPVGWAWRHLHRPDADSDVDQLNEGTTPAHARLSYGELLELQVELRLLRGLERRQRKRHVYALDRRVRQVLLEILPFRLTEAQRRVLKEITADLEDPYPMLRLLQGDVGSGKTIVAVLALVMALESGLQGAFMAPTELLAEQHYRTIDRLLRRRYRIELLTSSVENASSVRSEVAAGKVQLIIGTHALIQQTVEFSRLGLAIVDEQHRFGVSQRRLLQQKGDQPDLLVMTATPIPRSLALTVYGDLSLSVIDELPPGRQPIETRVVSATHRQEQYRWLRRQLEDGSQAYVVFPLIEDSERLAAESIDRMGARLRESLQGYETAVLHGRVSASERERIMRRFRAGDLKVLIATTVIEVGVDVPNASVMIIESGERFGLSQLHQLRGRIGRGRRRSHCVAIHGALNDLARRRLEVFAASQDGFEIAEFDLEIRGPGDLLGTRQSGLPLFRMANLVRDREWLERARSDARDLIDQPAGSSADSSFMSPIRARARSRYQSFAGG